MSYEYDGGRATTRHHEFLLAFRVRMATLRSSCKRIMQTISTECLEKAKLEGFAHITGSFTSPESDQQSQQSRSKGRFTRWLAKRFIVTVNPTCQILKHFMITGETRVLNYR